MLFKDENDFPVDSTLDGGDSSVRAGILGMTKGHSGTMFDFRAYESNNYWGMFMRHPNQAPSNNIRNYTRDQAKVFLGGLHALSKSGINYHLMARRFFWKRLQSFFFMQNTERDVVGSVKMQRPHYFYKDSKPNAITYPMIWNWKTFKFEIPQNTAAAPLENYFVESKMFDAPDILLPNEIGQIIIVGRVWQFYWILPVCFLFHILALCLNFFSEHEQNQIIGESYVYGTLKIYKIFQPEYAKLLFAYWTDRDEGEYAVLLIEMIEKV